MKVCSTGTEGRDGVLKQEFWEIFNHFLLSKFAEISNFIIYVFDLRFCRLPSIQYCTFWSTVIQFCMETYLQFHESRIIYLLDLRHILRITELNNQERNRQINGKGEMREELAALCGCSRNTYKG